MCDACANTDIERRVPVRGSLAPVWITLKGSAFFGHDAQAQPVRSADTTDVALKLLVDANASRTSVIFPRTGPTLQSSRLPSPRSLDAQIPTSGWNWRLIKRLATFSWSASPATS